MTCMGAVTHNADRKWSVTEGVDLAYDVGNPHCCEKIKVKWLGYKNLYGDKI